MLKKFKKSLSNLKQIMFPRDYISMLKARGLTVGENLNIQKNVIIDESHCWHISIGNNVTLAPNVHILAHDASTKIFLNYTKLGKVNIGSKVFIGASTIVLPGVNIGDNVVIGAGSLVNTDIPSNSVAVGNPVRVVSSIEEFLTKKKNEIQEFPNFDESYTLGQNVSVDKRNKMNKMMSNNFAYIV